MSDEVQRSKIGPTSRAVLHVGGAGGGRWRAGLAWLGHSSEMDVYVAVADCPGDAMVALRAAFEADHPGMWEPDAA